MLLVHPVAYAADTALHLDLHGMKTEGALADHALGRIHLDPLLSRRHTPGGTGCFTESLLFNRWAYVYQARWPGVARARVPDGCWPLDGNGFGMRRFAPSNIFYMGRVFHGIPTIPG